MAPAAAVCPSLHELEGSCEYCGEPCDSTQDELNAINCTFEGCPSPEIYHQSCIEAYLKSIRLDKQRKTGFQCPRGCGKGSKWDKPCPGRVTKSHPIHARNDSSKKRRKAKMPEPAPQPVISSTSKKQATVSRSKSMKSDKEKSPEIEECKATTTPAKAQVLNRASTFPSSDKSCAISCSIGEIQGVSLAGAMQKSKVGSPHGNTSTASYSEKCSDSGSADTSDSEDSVSSQQSSTPSRDFKEALAGPKYGATPPVANAWASGRPRNGDIFSAQGQKEQILAVPLEIRPSPTQPATRPENLSTSLQQPQLSQTTIQPVSADLASLEAEESELEERRKRARTKNEKKHVQRAAARLREKREALLAAASAATKQVVEDKRSIMPSSESLAGKAVVANRVDANGHVHVRTWSQSCLTAIMERKSTLVVKQLENLGFAPWQSMLSVRVNGVDLHHCLDWLLRNGSKIHANMSWGPSQPMDIRPELKKLDELRKLKDLTQDQIEFSVINKAGDVDAAVAHFRSGSRGVGRDVCTGPSQAQIPILTSRGGSTFGASPGSTASSWDGQLLSTSSNSTIWPSHSKTLDFQNPNQFAGGECISDISRYNARVGSENGYVSPRAGLAGSTNGRQGFTRDKPKSASSVVHVLSKDVIRPAERYSNNFSPVESFASTLSRQSSSKLELPYGRSPNDMSIGRSFTPQVNDDMSLSRSVSGSGYFQSHSDHSPLDNGCHVTSLFSEPTVSTVTSVTAAVLNDGRIDEQAIARMTESMDSTECSGLNTVHLHRIWGTQGLAVGSSSSFYSSDIAPKLNSSSAALSQVFSNGVSSLADSSSFGASMRNSYSGNWASNPISKSALTESIRSLGLSSACGGAVSETTFAHSLMNSDYPYGEAGSWSESSVPMKPQQKNGYFYSSAGLYEQAQMPFIEQQQPKNGLNGVYSQHPTGRNEYALAGSQLKSADIGNASSIWEQQSPGARPPIDEMGHDSLVSHLVEMLKV